MCIYTMFVHYIAYGILAVFNSEPLLARYVAFKVGCEYVKRTSI